MYESSSSQFFRTTTGITGIQSGPDVFDEPRLVMTVLTNLEILWNFRLVLEEKPDKEITESSRLEFLEKSSKKSSDAGINSEMLIREGIADTSKVARAKFLGNNRLLCFINIRMSGSFKNPFSKIIMSELQSTCRRFILFV